MSVETWEAEFAPPFDVDTMTVLDMVEWSIRKWWGLYPKARRKHALTSGGPKNWQRLYDGTGDWLGIGYDNCPLCRWFGEACARDGEECPITCWAEFDCWCDEGDPEPMIALLEEAHGRL